ncbi:MAG: helix-turn-helix transcriptional regulator [Peptococcaceae bacterium]|nr:helix-turn-helix transcriptional regulator [Peptococcaceae bacterium]
MNELKLSQNLMALRQAKGVTQEALADHIGVTKGAVSKWENAQSTPDITTLPLLASYFDVSVDALLGYEPQLDEAQIKAKYEAFAQAFASEPFEEVMAQVEKAVKEYYACYPFLFQMALLLLNHFMLAKDQARQQQVIAQMDGWLARVLANSKDDALKSDARILQTLTWMQLGRVEDAIDVLEKVGDPYRLSHNCGSLLVTAYRMHGDADKATRFAQLQMFDGLMRLLQMSMMVVSLHATDPEVLAQTEARMNPVIAAFDLEQLNGNATAQYYFQMAVAALAQGDSTGAIARLEGFVRAIGALFAKKDFRMTGDDYFTSLADWQDELPGATPRSRETIRQDTLAQVTQIFGTLSGNPDYERIITKLKAVMA